MSKFTEREQTIIEYSAKIRGKNFDLFTPTAGIIK
jgi:hypothetical protein